MTSTGEPEKSEEELDEEAVERFDGESIAPTPEVDSSWDEDRPTDADFGQSDTRRALMMRVLSKPVIGAAMGLVIVVAVRVLLRNKRAEKDRRDEERKIGQKPANWVKQQADSLRQSGKKNDAPPSLGSGICRLGLGRVKIRG